MNDLSVYDESIRRRLRKAVSASGLDAGVLGYEEQPEGFSCKRCVFFIKDGAPCKVVDGLVTADSCCDFWATGDRAYDGPLLSPTSAALVTTDPAGNYVCGGCRFLQAKNNCPVVGYVVDPQHGTCTTWEPAPSNS